MTDLSHFPSALVNNSREIVRKAIERYQENPNDRNAQTLENYGFSVDHDDYRDRWGEHEQSGNN